MSEFVSRGGVLAFAQRKYSLVKRQDGTPVLPHLIRVAETAEELVRQVYRRQYAFISPNRALDIDYVFCAGILHDSVEQTDIDFDGLVDMTNVAVAQYVAELSFDRRLAPPRRIMEYAGRLAVASFEVKLIKLVDIVDDLRTAIALFDQHSPADLVGGVARWRDDVRQCLAAIRRELSMDVATRGLEAEASRLSGELGKKIEVGQGMKSQTVKEQRESRSVGRPIPEPTPDAARAAARADQLAGSLRP